MAICTICGRTLNKEEAELHKCNDIIRQLNELDFKAIRPLLDGEPDRLEEIKQKKTALRNQLNNL